MGTVFCAAVWKRVYFPVSKAEGRQTVVIVEKVLSLFFSPVFAFDNACRKSLLFYILGTRCRVSQSQSVLHVEYISKEMHTSASRFSRNTVIVSGGRLIYSFINDKFYPIRSAIYRPAATPARQHSILNII